MATPNADVLVYQSILGVYNRLIEVVLKVCVEFTQMTGMRDNISLPFL